MVAVYLDKKSTVTGIVVGMETAGNYTADNENRVGLYKVVGTTYTLVASSPNNGDLWKASAGRLNVAFSTPYIADAGAYYIAFLLNYSAKVTTPQLYGANAALSTGQPILMGGGETAVNPISGFRSNVTALASSYTCADLSFTGVIKFVGLY
jgi:hypothetical protein